SYENFTFTQPPFQSALWVAAVCRDDQRAESRIGSNHEIHSIFSMMEKLFVEGRKSDLAGVPTNPSHIALSHFRPHLVPYPI
ncbi:hypothetical protein RZO55_12495, partial [Clostridium boliviensis]